MVVDRAILQISTNKSKLTLPHRILFSGDARINFPAAWTRPQEQCPFFLYPHLLVHYIMSRHTCLTSHNHCGGSNNGMLVTTLAASQLIGDGGEALPLETR